MGFRGYSGIYFPHAAYEENIIIKQYIVYLQIMHLTIIFPLSIKKQFK